MLDAYMRSAAATHRRGVPYAHTKYPPFYKSVASKAKLQLDEDEPIAPCVLLLKPFDEKYAILPASELVNLDVDALEQAFTDFVEANRQPKPSLPIAKEGLMRSWIRDRIEHEHVAVFALLPPRSDGGEESRLDAFMRVGGSDEMRRRVKYAHTFDPVLFAGAFEIGPQASAGFASSGSEPPSAPFVLLIKPFDEMFALLPSSELTGLDNAGFEARLTNFVEANWQGKPSCPLSSAQGAAGASAPAWAALRRSKQELAVIALFAEDGGPQSTVDAYMRVVGSGGIKGVIKAAHTTTSESFAAAAEAANVPLDLFDNSITTTAPCLIFIKPFDEKFALLPSSESSPSSTTPASRRGSARSSTRTSSRSRRSISIRRRRRTRGSLSARRRAPSHSLRTLHPMVSRRPSMRT